MTTKGLKMVLAVTGALTLAMAAPAFAANTSAKTGHQAAGTTCQHPGTPACQSAIQHRAALDASKARADELARIHQRAAASDAQRQIAARQAAQQFAQAQAAQRAFGAGGLARFAQRSASGNPYGQLRNGNGQHNAGLGTPRGFNRRYAHN